MSYARSVLARAATEAQFQDWLIAYATLRGWLAYHTHDSRHSAKGFPDVTLVRDGRLVLTELKSMIGKYSAEQLAWAVALREVEGIEYYLWRPIDVAEIEEILR